MTAPDIAADLRQLAARLQRLAPDRRNPEAYHVEKNDLVATLKVLAAAISKGAGNAQ